ncbi:MAG: ergothioneine biosynthesis protein EgtB [Polyangiaceae bacterium]|nr:ergothioneine biosynthesis protein EgtB [Polyangiaceae bacterium]
MTSEALADWISDARDRTRALYADIDDARWAAPYLAIINPPLWELGHVAWFQERWVLRHALGRAPLRADADALWDSAKVAHRRRWDLPLPSRAETDVYLQTVGDLVLDAAASARPMTPVLRYFLMLATFHEDMHGEALVYTRQTMGWSAPRLAGLGAGADRTMPGGACAGDVRVPGGRVRVGAERDSPPLFVFDNEKWAHDVELRPYSIARAPVTQREFAMFVDDGGYRRRELWSDEGRQWLDRTGAEHPVYWRRADGDWERRVFDTWVSIAMQPDRPMIHISAYEAEAWCRWAGRRLPTEAEWECAAAGAPIDLDRANLDLSRSDTVDVGAFPNSESVFRCRQMIGNVWEWTSTAFEAYPGFERDPYAEYSEPWFGDHRVLRGGCFATRARLLRPTWRNFYTPDRRDVWAGFRTCALD